MKSENRKPPTTAERLIRRMFPDDGHDTTVCDLEEAFQEIARDKNLFSAKIWYWFQTFFALRPIAVLRLKGSLGIAGHHFKIMARSLKRHRSYAFINIFGLAVSFTVVILIALYIRNELSYDRENVHLDRMYTVMMGGEYKGQYYSQQSVISAAGLELSEHVPEIVEYTRLNRRMDYALHYRDIETDEEKEIMIKGMTFAWVDPGMFEVFTYDFSAGDPGTVLDEPYTVVLTEEIAKSLFGTADGVGRVVTLNGRYDLTVTGVVAKPKNSHLNLNVFASILTVRSISGPDADRNYIYNSTPTYVLLPEQHNLDAVNRKIDAHMADVFRRVDRPVQDFFLFPVRNIYMMDKRWHGHHGSTTLLWILSTIGIFIVMISGINFINLSTARASTRAREIGIKKVVGVMRSSLRRQFLAESVFLALSALSISLMLSATLLPVLRRAFGTNLTLNSLFDPGMLIGFAAGACLIGLLSGLYPALYLSDLQPVAVIRNESVQGRKGAFFRKALIVFQFAVSVILIIGTLTITRQIRFARNKDLGFSSENVITFSQPRSAEFRSHLESIKTELLSHPDILEVSFSQGYPGNPQNNESLKIGEEYIGFTHYSVDSDFADVYGLELLAGRSVDSRRPGDHLRAVVLNETAVSAFGLDAPVGTRMPYVTGGNLTAFPVDEIEIVGVVKDFHCRSLHREINPVLISYNPDWMGDGGILHSGENFSGVVSHIEAVWKQFAPGFPFEFSFLDREIEEMYANDARFEKIFLYASGFSILIASLGLLGLSSYVAARRTKEIGIRRVLGASLSQILYLLSSEFTAAILLANCFAWPAAYFLMKKWLMNFAYRIDLRIDLFLISALLALGVALLTVGRQSFKAAAADPVKTLRIE